MEITIHPAVDKSVKNLFNVNSKLKNGSSLPSFINFNSDLFLYSIYTNSKLDIGSYEFSLFSTDPYYGYSSIFFTWKLNIFES